MVFSIGIISFGKSRSSFIASGLIAHPISKPLHQVDYYTNILGTFSVKLCKCLVFLQRHEISLQELRSLI